MSYATLVKIINFLIKIANKIRLVKCSNNGECLCDFCTNQNCKMRDKQIDKLI